MLLTQQNAKLIIGLSFLFIPFCAFAESENDQNKIIQDNLNQALVIDRLYQEVFKDPSNIELNIALVQEQILFGDFKGASGTLERLLIIAPENRTAQFLMARVKAANKNYEEARYYLSQVIAAEDTKESLRINSEDLLAEIEKARDGFSWSANMGVNAGFSRNPDAKPDNPSYSLLAPTIPIDVKGGSQEYVGLSLGGSFDFRLNTYESRVLRVTLSHQRRDFLTYDKADFETYGGNFQFVNDDQSPFLASVNVNRVRVKDFDYMDSIGLNTQQSFNLTPQYRINGVGSITRQVHRATPHFTTNEEKTGYQGKLDLSVNAYLSGYQVKLGTGYERKTANESPNAYHTYKANIGSTLPIGPLSVNTNLSLSQKKYDAADLVFSEERRRENSGTLSMSAMLPIQGYLSRLNDRLQASLSASMTKTDSNVDKFKSTRGEMTLNFIYSFGGE